VRSPCNSNAHQTVSRVQRDLTMSTLLKATLLGTGLMALVLGPLVGLDGVIVLLVIVVLWLVLSFRSVRGSRLAAASQMLIASGHYEEAERQLHDALRSFSLFRTVKLMSLHHLAVLRHAQQRWVEAAVLSRGLLRHRLGALQSLSRSSRLLLSEALLELNDLAGAHEALAGLYRERLTLNEALHLLAIQSEYEARVGAWGHLATDLKSKVGLAELLPPARAVRVQSLLARAAREAGRPEWAAWLEERVALLADDASGARRESR
jgi:hypothetical protein